MGFFGDLLDKMTRKDRWMERAAGVSTMRLVCHADTWAALERLPAGPVTAHHLEPISATPERITERCDGMLEIVLSGPEVVRLLRVTHYHKQGPSLPEPHALGERTFRAFGAVLDTVGPHSRVATEIPPVVLDDRPEGTT